jgi:PAS domain S-box-containing protein
MRVGGDLGDRRDRACRSVSAITIDVISDKRRLDRRRRKSRERRRRLALFVVLAALAPVTYSYVTTMLRPSSLPLSVRTVEWVRAHHGNWLVDEVEHYYYSWKAPKKGGPQLTSLPSVGLSAAPSIGRRPARVRRHRAAVWPRRIKLVFAHPLPGEGVWRRTGPLVGARLEINALRSDHRTFPAELAITRVDVPGPLLFAVSLRDVTKRREREERLKEAEGKYRTLVEQIPLATYINDTGMPVHTRYMSPQIETMLGYPVSDWLQPNFFMTCLHPDDHERVFADVERTHDSGQDFRCEYRLIAADGRTVWVLDETVAVRDEEYRPIFLQGFLVDVTDRRASDDALRESEELHRLVVEGSRDLITLLDPAGKVRYASPAVQTVLGWLPEEVHGRRWTDDVHPDDVEAVNAYYKNREAGVDAPPLGVRVQHKDGSWVALEGSLSPTRTPDGTVTGFVGVSRPLPRSVLRPAAS